MLEIPKILSFTRLVYIIFFLEYTRALHTIVFKENEEFIIQERRSPGALAKLVYIMNEKKIVLIVYLLGHTCSFKQYNLFVPTYKGLFVFPPLKLELKLQTCSLKLAPNFSPSHIRVLELTSEIKCSKAFTALKFIGNPNRPLCLCYKSEPL